MKSLTQAMQGAQHAIQHGQQQPKQQLHDGHARAINYVIGQLKVIFSAIARECESNPQHESNLKKQYVMAFEENGINTKAQLDRGLKKARTHQYGNITPGQFVHWCVMRDDDSAFWNCIKKKRPSNIAEWKTAQEVGYRIRNELPEDKARLLYFKTLDKYEQQVRDGVLVEADYSFRVEDKTQPPKRELTPEEKQAAEVHRLQRLDAQIDDMLAKGIRLLGPHRKRYLERKCDE